MPRKTVKVTRNARAPKAQVALTVAEGTCECACGAPVKKGRSFAQGHDAKLHSALNKAYRAGARTLSVNGKRTTLEARYIRSGWSFPPAAKSKKAAKVAA